MNEDLFMTIEKVGEEVVLKKCSIYTEEKIVVPEGVTIIEEGAFDGCKQIKSLVVPASVVCMKPSYEIDLIREENTIEEKRLGEIIGWSLEVLDFQGEIPETNNAFVNSWIDVLRVNQSRKACSIPDDIVSAFHIDESWHKWSIVYAAPESFEGASPVPGYIRITKTDNDELIDINTKYIVSVEPLKLDRYKPHIGSVIKCAVKANERGYEYKVYEPCDKVLGKMDTSLRMLSKQVGGVAGLLNQLETLCVDKLNLK